MILLSELLAAPGAWRYGYDLMKATGLGAGTLYPILIRLSDYGWLTTRWDTRTERGRPPRHLYRLTGQGIRGARDLLDRAAEREWDVGGLAGEASR